MSATVSKLTKARNLIEKQKGARYAKNMSNKITHELILTTLYKQLVQ